MSAAPTPRSRRPELAAALRSVDASIAAARVALRDAPSVPAPGAPGELLPSFGAGAPDAGVLAAARLLHELLERRAVLERELRELDLERRSEADCEAAALEWLNAVTTAEQLLEEIIPDPRRQPLPPRRRREERPPEAALRIARLILRFRNSQPEGRLTSLDSLRAVRGMTEALLADLLHTGCARLGPPETGPPVGVLMPLRIETRFDSNRLRIRVVPDDPWFSYHDGRASAAELDALERAIDNASQATDQNARRLVFHELVGQVGGARAVWLSRSFLGTDAGGQPVVVRPPAAELRTEPGFPRIVGFPRTLKVWIGRGGRPPAVELTLNVDRSRLLVDLPNRRAGERRWWEDWDEAVDAGLAGEIPLSGEAEDIDILLVTGLSDEAPGALFKNHRDGGSLGLLAPGTATNTVGGAPAGSLARDPDEWWEVLQGMGGDSARRVSRALTGDPDLLGALPGNDEPHRDISEALVAGLWPALWGFAGADIWGVVPGSDAAGAWAPHALFPEGPYPTLRVGSQPYGLLPATALRRWVPANGDPPVEAGLPTALELLRERWVQAAHARGTVAGADTDTLLALLSHLPTAPSYRHRRALPLELWWFSLLILGFNSAWRDFDDAWVAHYPLAAQLGLTPARRYGARSLSRRLRLPLVRPDQLPASQSVGDVLQELVDLALSQPATFAAAERIERGRSLDSLLLRLALRSLQVALGDVGREVLGETAPQPEPLARIESDPGELERRIELLTDSMLGTGSPASLALQRTCDGLVRLRDIDEDRLERLLRATLDCAIYRVDPWFVGLPARRLQDLLDGGDTGQRLGAYGWVDAPRPGAPGPTAAGLIHAPSQAQALTAAVLRDRAINDPEPRWHLDLTSQSVRAADRVAEQVRVGAHLADALGREVERIVGRRSEVEKLRDRFPLRTEHAGRRTCDGLAVLAEDPATLGLDAAALAGLDGLRAGVDAYGDLLVAEAVHHVTQGRAESAGAAMDAAAGLSRPPRLEVLRTPREGRAVATSALLLVPAVADPPLPTTDPDRAEMSPASLADASAAAFIAAQTGAATTWRWDVSETAAGGATTTVLLSDLDLLPADALALPQADLERLVIETGAATLGVDRDAVELTRRDGSRTYEAAARLAGLLGRAPAGPDAVAREPDVAAGGSTTAAIDADLGSRYGAVRDTAELLAQLLTDELALTSAGQLGGADPATLGRLVTAARQWGIAPDPAGATAANGGQPPHPLVFAAARAAGLLEARLAATPAAPATLSRPEVTDALARLVSPTGQLAILSRLPLSDLPTLQRAGGGAGVTPLDTAWLPVVAAVREPLARLELHQLTAGSAHGAGPALAPWSSKPADPWQQVGSDNSRLVVAYTAAALDLTALPASASVAAGVLDRFTETVPAEPQSTSAVFGFDAPAARAPQAILLAVPPDLATRWDDETLRDVVLETRELAHVRMARPAELDDAARSLLPSVLLPAGGRTRVTLDPRQT